MKEVQDTVFTVKVEKCHLYLIPNHQHNYLNEMPQIKWECITDVTISLYVRRKQVNNMKTRDIWI